MNCDRSAARPPCLMMLESEFLLRCYSDPDFVEKPIGSCRIGNVFRAVRKGDVANQPVAIPVFGTVELAEDIWIK